MNFLVIFLLKFSFIANDKIEGQSEFIKWKEKYGNLYEKNSNLKSEREAARDFYKNLLSIHNHNKNELKTYEQGLNEASFLNFEEIRKYRLGLQIPVRQKFKRHVEKLPKNFSKVMAMCKPKPSLNYTKHFPSIPINQGICLSCWAITAAEIVEAILKKKGQNWRLSVQNLVDCSKLSYGCNGGWPSHAYKYVKDEGVSNGSSYTYVGAKQECQRVGKKFKPIVRISDYCEVKVDGKEDQLKKILTSYGPVSVAIYTTNGFNNYKGGIFYDVHCRNYTVDHAITLVGYGSDKVGNDFWIIRNSWGPEWGFNGYGLMARNRNNACGIALYAMFPCEKEN